MIDVLGSAEAVQVAPELIPVYLSAFGAPGYDETPERAEQVATEGIPTHAKRDDFKLVVSRANNSVTGFAYGFTGHRGQWWADRVATAVTPELEAEWIGGHFEVVCLAVRVEEQRQGLGAALMQALMADLTNRKGLLTTYSDDRPAPRLYRRLGWKLLVPDLGWGSALYGLDRGVPDGQ